MLKLKLSILTIFVFTNLYGQKIEKVYLDKTDSTKNFYTIIYPPELDWKGYIVILPGFGQNAERVLEQTNLPKLTARNGLLTIIPTLQDGVLSFGIDNPSQKSLKNIIQDVKSKHQIDGQNFYIGGFSIGGSAAIKYAQNANVKPKAVFGIDPPLDFERFYNSSKRDIRLSIDKEPSQENVYMVKRIEEVFNGTPETALSNFHKISPYSFSDTNQSAVKKFGNIPLRIYSEPDVKWWLKERDADLTSMNITECSAFINELNRLGNDKAELILTENKGYRKPNNSRHPHSWSIVENEDLIGWILEQH
ncbi:MAG: alpha/beta hydrolase [Bacteroidota bacterium]